MLPQFKFNERVAVEAILYILSKTNDRKIHHVMKILYFADRFHLERFGRFICGDRYIAMEHGPVPSDVYHIFQQQRGEIAELFPMAKKAIAMPQWALARPLREPDMDWLSPSEIQCIDESLAKYDRYNFLTLKDKSHDAAYKSVPLNGTMSLESIVDVIGNPEGLLEYLIDPNP